MRITLLLVLLSTAGLSIGQERTVGLLSYDQQRSYDGFNLLYPHSQPNVYLLNNCGEVVHVWDDESEFRPGNSAYLLPNGNLVKTKRHFVSNSDPLWFPGGGAIVEIRSWDNELLWSFELNNARARLHHDIEPLPNGNILMIAWEVKSKEEVEQAGRDRSISRQDTLAPDYILEVNPDTDEIVWEWHAWDHLIQDFDSQKDNFGVVRDNPQLINVNWDRNSGLPDWMHTNSIAYNPVLDQIVLSVPYFDEIWVIDHSTTTEEAASHEGGKSNRGGDLLYRWGNAAAYNQALSADQKLFFQHDAHWVMQHHDVSFQHYGKLAVFNNLFTESYSSAHLIDPVVNYTTGNYPLDINRWGPETYDLTVTHPEPTAMYSGGVSSAQWLPNGNVLLCSGRQGYNFELTPDGDIVWEYVTPIRNGFFAAQGEILQENQNLTFKLHRYPADYAAFDGKDLSAKGYLELDPDSLFCSALITRTLDPKAGYIKVYPNPAYDQIFLNAEGVKNRHMDVQIFDTYGRLVMIQHTSVNNAIIIEGLTPGLYLARLATGETFSFCKL